MNRSFKNCLALGFVLAASSTTTSQPVLAANRTQPSPTITVRIYNYARATQKVLARAKQEATIIFNQAELKMTWLDCPLSMAEFESHADCQQPSEPATLILRILPRAMAERELSGDTLGYTLPGPAGTPGRIANVFY